MRGRGLKQAVLLAGQIPELSPPMRGRGLKLTIWEDEIEALEQSPPMRGRGLKLVQNTSRLAGEKVAPHAGAWIETVPRAHKGRGNPVAPHAGAWIETAEWNLTKQLCGSPPMRGRGLKQRGNHEGVLMVESPPMRGRGLKPVTGSVNQLS